MYRLIAEQPLLVSAMLAALVAAFVAGWLQSGKRGLLAGAAIAGVMIPLAWVLADRLVTDRERIRQMVGEVAAAVEANDHAGAVKYLADESLRRRVLAELPRYVFSTAKINQIREIVIRESAIPPTADVEMSVKVDVSERSGTLQDVRVVRVVELELEKIGSGDSAEWLITDYAHYPISGQADIYSQR